MEHQAEGQHQTEAQEAFYQPAKTSVIQHSRRRAKGDPAKRRKLNAIRAKTGRLINEAAQTEGWRAAELGKQAHVAKRKGKKLHA